MKFSGRKIESGMPGTPLGNPMAALVGSTRVFFASVGHWLGGGSTPSITQSRKATRIRLTSPVAGTGFASNVPVPQLLPGHPTTFFGGRPIAAAVRRAGQVVSADVLRHRNVVLRRGADPGGRHLQRKHLGAAERLDDLRARLARFTAVEDARRMQTADRVGELVPPLGTFAAHLIELEHAVWLSPA